MSGGQRNSTDKAVARLEAEWPLWEFWLVPTAYGPKWWCARLKLDHGRVLNARSAAGLAELLEDAAGGAPV